MAAALASKCSRVGRSFLGGLGNNLSGLLSASHEMTCNTFLSQQQRTFIQMRTILKVVDNSGAKKVMCIQALKARKKGARLGDTIVASVKEAHPNGKVKKGKVVYGVVVRAAMQRGRCDGSEVKFDDNAVVLVDKQGQPIGTRVFGPVPHESRLGALDGTYIRVHVPEADKPRYRSKRNEIATNVLGVCSQDMQFIYVLPGWEGSAADSRVLRDSISRRHGLRVSHGYYYLVDAGMDLQENLSRSSATKSGRNKEKQPSHTWTPVEDVALVEALTELCLAGHWKVDNGFRSGYLGQLEKIIEQKIPNCGLKVDPHILSRVKTLKKQTLAISDMIANSIGFSWDHENKMIVCETQVFDDWVKVHKDAKGLRLKLFIHYDSLVEAFGKDRANGLGAEGPAEVVEDLNNNNEFVDLEGDGLCENVVPTSATHTPSAPSSTRTRKRPRDAYAWET
ncbi:hypothetical protein ACLB2K_013157 [Fragaria x ananassa]